MNQNLSETLARLALPFDANRPIAADGEQKCTLSDCPYRAEKQYSLRDGSTLVAFCSWQHRDLLKLALPGLFMDVAPSKKEGQAK